METRVAKVSRRSRVTFEGAALVRKHGTAAVLRREVEAMDYVRRHTAIPIPTILEVYLGDASGEDKSFILMQRLPGLPLDAAWPQMSDVARAATVRQLRSHLAQLHHLRSATPGKEGWIGSASGGPAYDHRLSSRFPAGPFASVAEFHDFLVAPVRQCPRPEWVHKYRPRLSDQHQAHFAHADLSWEHIFVDASNGSVTGILDWEMAGFWPEWWEYRKAWFGCRSRHSWWVRIVGDVMREYMNETEVDMDLEMF